jgi:LysM repeat protein
MKKHFFFLFFIVACGLLGQAQSSAVVRQYIATFKDIAMQEMIRTGVPASITLAQGIHETGAGQSVLVKKSNNHFGIKCKTGWTGPSVSHDDDARGECFRSYEDPIESYKDHSDFLKERKHYASLFLLDPLDYEGWARGLKKAGYATNPKYPQILIRLIEDYNLQDYTLIAMGKKQPELEHWASNRETVPAAPKKTYPQGRFRINETDVVFVNSGTSFLAIAEEYRVPLARLFEFNDMEPAETALEDQLVFLQRKRKKGAAEFHIVQPGETVYDIAQQQGIRLETLLEYNKINRAMQPAAAEKLYLQQHAPGAPKLIQTPKELVAVAQVLVQEEQYKALNDVQNIYLTHTVQAKETLYAIAKQYGVTVDELQKWNNLQQPGLKTGQQLRIIKKAEHVTY